MQHIDISDPKLLSSVLAKHFSPDEVTEILEAAGTKEFKDMLAANVSRAVELGAFGAPFFSVTNAEGKTEPFFGSDRFHFMWEFLGLRVEHLRIRKKGEGGGGGGGGKAKL